LLGQWDAYKLPFDAGRFFSSSGNVEVADIIDASWVVVSRAVECCPDRLTLKVPQGLDVVLFKNRSRKQLSMHHNQL